MNWQKIISVVWDGILVWGLSFFGGGFYAFVISGLCRIVFNLEENTAFIWIGGPLLFVLTIWFSIFLPKHLRKVGLIE